MAEAWAKYLGSDCMNVYSAGTKKYHEVKPLAVKVMNEAGMDMSTHFPKLLSDIPDKFDYLIRWAARLSVRLFHLNIKKIGE